MTVTLDPEEIGPVTQRLGLPAPATLASSDELCALIQERKNANV